MRVSHTSLIVSAVLALLAGSDIRAQWTNVAPGIIAGNTYGALIYKDGMLWAGHSQLYSSPDSGKTWTRNSFSGGTIQDIQFYDRFTGIISTQTGVYITRDGGFSWTELGSIPNCRSIAFGGSASVIYALQDSPPR